MSIVGSGWHDLEQWNADKNEIIRCQDSIACQERALLRAESYIGTLHQSINQMAEKLELERQVFLRQNASILNVVNSLSIRMDDLDNLQDKIAQQNNDTAALIQQMISDKRAIAQSSVDLYNEAAAQFILMESNPAYRKFAEIDLNNLRKRIENGREIDWTIGSMQAQAEKLLSDVYLIGLQVSEREKQYETCQSQCAQLAMRILEQSSEFRQKGDIYGYRIGNDVDYWTGDSLKKLETEVSQILAAIEMKINDPAFQLDQLKNELSRLEVLRLEKDRIIDCAIENACRSERTQAEVRLAVDILSNHDFELLSCNYEWGDERRPFIARMRRATDDAEVAFICGYDSATGQYKLAHSMSYKAYNDANVCNVIEQDIMQSLIDNGLEIRSNQSCGAKDLPVCSGDNPNIDVATREQLGECALSYEIRQNI